MAGNPATCSRGFTLIETLMVMAIAGILASIAYPSYLGQLQRSRRADATQALWTLQQAQERYRANHLLYGKTLADIGIHSELSSGGYYTLTLTEKPHGKGYLATATAILEQAHDAPCVTLVMSVDQGSASLRPAACWSP